MSKYNFDRSKYDWRLIVVKVMIVMGILTIGATCYLLLSGTIFINKFDIKNYFYDESVNKKNLAKLVEELVRSQRRTKNEPRLAVL